MGMRKLTFKEYLDSKTKLLEAIQETPVVEQTYVVKKYCKIRIGESKEAREEIALKPKQEVKVKWCYEDTANPEPEGLIFEHIHPEVEQDVYWSGKKLMSWLSKNTVEKL